MKEYMQEHLATYTAKETKALGAALAREFKPGTLVCFFGDLGAGKTTLIQGLLAECGAERPYVSPTFVLMKQYDLARPTPTGIERIYHADAYRIESAEDFAKLGFAEWCTDPEGLVLLEWPERVSNLLPTERINITLTLGTGDTRDITIHFRT